MLFFLFKLFVCVRVCARFRMSKSHNMKEQKYCICFGVVIYCTLRAASLPQKKYSLEFLKEQTRPDFTQ